MSSVQTTACGCVGTSAGVTQNVCIETKQVYDAALSQTKLDNVVFTIPTVELPATFNCARATSATGTISNLSITPIPDCPRYVRVQADVTIPIELHYCDALGEEHIFLTSITLAKDVAMYVPCPSVVPYELDSIVGVAASQGSVTSATQITVTLCVNLILKIVAEVILMVPSRGYCAVPEEVSFSGTNCSRYFGLPLFPNCSTD